MTVTITLTCDGCGHTRRLGGNIYFDLDETIGAAHFWPVGIDGSHHLCDTCVKKVLTTHQHDLDDR